jgi:hypothetical protein
MPAACTVRTLSDKGKLAIAQWYAAAVVRPSGEELKRLYLRTERLLALLPDTVSSASIMLDARLTRHGRTETMTLALDEHAMRCFDARARGDRCGDQRMLRSA